MGGGGAKGEGGSRESEAGGAGEGEGSGGKAEGSRDSEGAGSGAEVVSDIGDGGGSCGVHVMQEVGLGLCVAKWRAGDILQCLCRGKAEVWGWRGGGARGSGQR